MKQDIHPKYYPEAVFTCSCGNSWVGGSTKAKVHTDVCSACHPFFTGEQRIVDTEGQVERFYRRLERAQDVAVAEGDEAQEE
ncbi:MAG: 50S ribosomal protein L31 [Anaerolineae bacterium]|nr:MAG: 50S ribosomal protein L31 [Anaerolineae bacterium]